MAEGRYSQMLFNDLRSALFLLIGKYTAETLSQQAGMVHCRNKDAVPFFTSKMYKRTRKGMIKQQMFNTLQR
jgi:hypothetical protein